ncbi:von Willebrand factor A domain-containing protein 8 [Anopheles aquasalis]|uniref:von Willebrand factor A domain-containing protein 8 n=1 Tax=Anopheles aquasalis TaxID=42839 RepID=UPI00215AE9EA|nr:von Willebrand factor A domain-containing protein 8 [Anopheles aquasalis]
MQRNVQTVRRINVLQRILAHQHPAVASCTVRRAASSTANDGATIEIGDVTMQVEAPRHPELVPTGYYYGADGGTDSHLSQTRLHHLRWMLQKDKLGQDMMLLGRPGRLRRHLVMQYAELTRREVEYVLLNRDTTESDLKQRREIRDGTATYHNQGAVRAATEGRLLVIEGVEKAERNVLPILNNLLENREMHLEDGRFLISAKNYDSLRQRYDREQLDRWGLVRVSEEFRVVALGLPVPRYRGAPLDPPLRSRFQARDVPDLPYVEVLLEAKELAGGLAPPDVLTRLVSFAYAVQSATAGSLPDFPIDNLRYAGLLLRNNGSLTVHELIERLYPYRVFLEKEGIGLVASLLDSLQIPGGPLKDGTQGGDGDRRGVLPPLTVASVEPAANDPVGLLQVSLQPRTGGGTPVTVQVARGTPGASVDQRDRYVPTAYQAGLLADLLQTIAVGDVCLVGPRGCGKSVLAQQLCLTLDRQQTETMVLYQDMTARDLLQKRTTRPNGDTVWQDSPLLAAALAGHAVILDGIHRLHHSTLAILHRLVHDREMQLYDGRRLLHHERYDRLVAAEGGSGDPTATKATGELLRIHPGFRIIALAEPNGRREAGTGYGGTATSWIAPETLNLFLFHEVRGLSEREERTLLDTLYGPLDGTMEQIVDLAHRLRSSGDPVMRTLSTNLSTRQLLRIARRLRQYGERAAQRNAADIVHATFLSKFMPNLARNVLESAMERTGIRQQGGSATGDANDTADPKTPLVELLEGGSVLRLGRTVVRRYETEAISKVPDIVFYDVPQHLRLMERLLQDFLLGEHLLLVGNQGVGKNKIADRLLQLMNRPREYIQLHRDTTVQSLTQQATVRDGRIEYEDSPLVKAVRAGHVLVVDEADKAPIHVTCILKTLVENGEMLLSDGRRICPPSVATSADDHRLIPTHPDFRLVVLANRPGFPFLGNDFFSALGDLFSCHAVDNPSPDSELYLLRQYGPSVSPALIRQLVDAFAELRDMADAGTLHYPYSTREVVAIVKHLERFPSDPLAELIGNVLDHDRYAPETLEQVTAVLLRHGLPIGEYAEGCEAVAALRRQRQLQLTVRSHSGKGVSGPKHGKVDPNNDPHVGGNTWAGGTGGRDTAGLGGKGGPYRLDGGHPVHQLSDAEKDAVPESVKQAAREMNRKAFEEKLREIQMSPYEHKVYEQYSEPVRRQVQQLRITLQALQARAHERQWQKHRTAGELDDTKLVEGITGERAIYKQRAEQEPEPGQPQERPKRLKLVVDVSGSMYRFNGYDGRLDRQLEATAMVMEAFDGFEAKIRYDIVGHSGEAVVIPFVTDKNPPKDDKRRLETLKMMHAHSQFCWSGDHTLAATEQAVDEMAHEDCDEAIVIVLSDANLARYGISPRRLNEALGRQLPKVRAHVVFIGSLGDEAQIVANEMAADRAFVCMNLDQLPQIMRQIFASSLLH